MKRYTASAALVACFLTFLPPRHGRAAVLAAIALAVLAPVAGAACETETREVQGQLQTGCFVSGELEGAGSVAFPDGSRYAGDFVQGRRSGQGVMTFANGRVYKGSWAADRPHGRGIFTWADGNRYEGDYRAGQRHGHGIMTTQGGAARYEGWWRDDKEHGKGMRLFPDGKEYVGDFEAGRPHGEGFLRIDGFVFAGRFVRGKPAGRITLLHPDGSQQTGRMNAAGQFLPDTVPSAR